jgi:flagellin-like protein
MARKGVSPVLASLLLVVIVVAAAIATYLWVSSYIGSAGRGVEAPQFRELLKVEGVRAEGGSVVVTVRNIGNAKATLRAAYVMKGDVAVMSETLNVELEPGQAVDVKVSAQVPPGSYTVKIVTATGVEAIAPLPLSGAAQQPAQPEATLTVSVEPPEGGTTSPPPGEYRVAAGSAVTVRAEPNPGYAFSKWLLNGSDYSTSQEVTVTVRGSTSLTAVFSRLQPRFTITYWNQTITGPAGSKQRFVTEIENVGSANGTVEARVLDSGGALVGSVQITLQPGQRGTVEMLLTLPSTAGTYTWTVEAFNTATGSVDDRKSFTVTVLRVTELVKNGDFSNGSAYWTLQSPWYVDSALHCVRVNKTAQSIGASLWQTVNIPNRLLKLTLNFSYYLYAFPPGQVDNLTLVAEIWQNGNAVWRAEVSWSRNKNPTAGFFSQSVPLQLVIPGPATLNFTLYLVASTGLKSVDVRLDDISLMASAPP